MATPRGSKQNIDSYFSPIVSPCDSNTEIIDNKEPYKLQSSPEITVSPLKETLIWMKQIHY